MTGYINFLTQKELQINMSSVINVSNASNKSEGLSSKEIEVLIDNKEQNWFKTAHTGRCLGIVSFHKSTAKLSEEDKRSLAFLQAEGGICMDPDREDALDHDIFFSEVGVLYELNRSRKSTSKLNVLADIFGVKIHKNKWLFKEQESLQDIMDVLKGEEMLTQLSVDGYKIDLYFPRHKLAVECDEFSHKDRDIEYEVRRQKYFKIN